MASAGRILPFRRLLPVARLDRVRLGLEGGAVTTLHVARFPRATTRAALVGFARPRRLVEWCRAVGMPHAVVAGFFIRPEGRPLGELRIDGIDRDHVPFATPWGGRRACVAIRDGAHHEGALPTRGPRRHG